MLETPGEVTNWLETCGHLNIIKEIKGLRRLTQITLLTIQALLLNLAMIKLCWE